MDLGHSVFMAFALRLEKIHVQVHMSSGDRLRKQRRCVSFLLTEDILPYFPFLKGGGEKNYGLCHMLALSPLNPCLPEFLTRCKKVMYGCGHWVFCRGLF